MTSYSTKWRNLGVTKQYNNPTAQSRRERGFDDGRDGKPAVSLEREYQVGYRLGYRERKRVCEPT